MKKITIHFTVNHEPVTVEVEPNHRLIDVLRICSHKEKRTEKDSDKQKRTIIRIIGLIFLLADFGSYP